MRIFEIKINTTKSRFSLWGSYKILTFILGVLMVLLCSCSNDSFNKTEQTIKKMYHKKIIFSNSLVGRVLGRDTTFDISNEKSAKIVIFLDKNGCTPCRMKLSQWKRFISKVNKLNKKIIFIYILASNNTIELDKEFIIHKFKNVVFYDIKNEFAQINNLPDNSIFHTFLLNGNNEIIIVGNPVVNQSIKELYLREIRKL
ncbi:MAG: hypothetical protein L3J74_16885 [Bacteroidales bacterium]|nr:hypothetical protein [Bacteroidales bacterium]